MKIRLFIDYDLLTQGKIYSLDRGQSHYLRNVLRLKVGEEIFVFNNKDGEFLARVVSCSKIIEIEIIKKTEEFYLPPKIGLVFSPVKNVRAEYITTKATELGAIFIQPIECARTIVKKVNYEKLQLNIIEAAEQSRRVDLPILEPMKSLKQFMESLDDNDIIILADESGDGHTPEKLFNDIVKSNKMNNPAASNGVLGRWDIAKTQQAAGIKIPLVGSKFFIMVGPEGGFSDQERELIKRHQKSFSMILGPRILRADTAIIASLTMLQNYVGDIEVRP